MSKKIFCVKLQKEGEALDEAPYPGPLGEKIYNTVSAEAWEGWLAHQTMLINEYRLSPIDPKTRPFLEQEMDKYFFGGGSEKPAGFTENKT